MKNLEKMALNRMVFRINLKCKKISKINIILNIIDQIHHKIKKIQWIYNKKTKSLQRFKQTYKNKNNLKIWNIKENLIKHTI